MKSVKFDAQTVQTEEGPGAAAAAVPAKKRPRSAVKGKTGKVLPRAANKPNPNKGSGEEQATRKRGMPKLVPEEEEVKLSPEEIYEMEL